MHRGHNWEGGRKNKDLHREENHMCEKSTMVFAFTGFPVTLDKVLQSAAPHQRMWAVICRFLMSFYLHIEEKTYRDAAVVRAPSSCI